MRWIQGCTRTNRDHHHHHHHRCHQQLQQEHQGSRADVRIVGAVVYLYQLDTHTHAGRQHRITPSLNMLGMFCFQTMKRGKLSLLLPPPPSPLKLVMVFFSSGEILQTFIKEKWKQKKKKKKKWRWVGGGGGGGERRRKHFRKSTIFF